MTTSGLLEAPTSEGGNPSAPVAPLRSSHPHATNSTYCAYLVYQVLRNQSNQRFTQLLVLVGTGSSGSCYAYTHYLYGKGQARHRSKYGDGDLGIFSQAIWVRCALPAAARCTSSPATPCGLDITTQEPKELESSTSSRAQCEAVLDAWRCSDSSQPCGGNNASDGVADRRLIVGVVLRGRDNRPQAGS